MADPNNLRPRYSLLVDPISDTDRQVALTHSTSYLYTHVLRFSTLQTIISYIDTNLNIAIMVYTVYSILNTRNVVMSAND